MESSWGGAPIAAAQRGHANLSQCMHGADHRAAIFWGASGAVLGLAGAPAARLFHRFLTFALLVHFLFFSCWPTAHFVPQSMVLRSALLMWGQRSRHMLPGLCLQSSNRAASLNSCLAAGTLLLLEQAWTCSICNIEDSERNNLPTQLPGAAGANPRVLGLKRCCWRSLVEQGTPPVVGCCKRQRRSAKSALTGLRWWPVRQLRHVHIFLQPEGLLSRGGGAAKGLLSS